MAASVTEKAESWIFMGQKGEELHVTFHFVIKICTCHGMHGFIGTYVVMYTTECLCTIPS